MAAMITLCVTTTNRQDLLPACLSSAFAGTRVPDRVVIVDQANRYDLLVRALWAIPPRVPLKIVDLEDRRGCEASAINWYLTQIPEERIIAHDDVVFGPDSLAQFVATEGAFLIDSSQGVLTYRDACVAAVGLYDPAISPNYFRYCDVDYEDRLAGVGILPVVVDCGIEHRRDGTMRAYTEAEQEEYTRRVAIAEANYERKWKRPLTPGGSTIGRANWRRAQSATVALAHSLDKAHG